MMKKVDYITGGNKGVGFGMTEKRVEGGDSVGIAGDFLDTATKAAEEIGKEDKIIGLASDVRKLDSEEKAVATVKDHFGRLDVMIANAGLGVFDNSRDLKPEDWHKMIDTNLTGVFNSIKASVEDLVAKDRKS